MPEVARHAPMPALDGGADGLKFFRALAEMGPNCLSPGGFLMVEVGAGQAEAVGQIFQERVCFDEVKTVKDYAEIPRIVYTRLK